VIYYGGKVQALGTLKELLATPDAVRITTPVLPRETMERVLDIIRKDVDAGKVRVDNPTQNLESYFLDIVAKARASAAVSSGAQSGARVADYLRGEGEAKPATDKLLERLTLPTAAQKTEETKPISTTPAVSETKLAELTKTKPAESAPAPAAPSPETKPTAPAQDLSKANDKLSSLLGGKKG
jgi:hypothetical protein